MMFKKSKIVFLLNVVWIVFKTRVFVQPRAIAQMCVKIIHKRSRLLMTIISFFMNLKFQESFKHLVMKIWFHRGYTYALYEI